MGRSLTLTQTLTLDNPTPTPTPDPDPNPYPTPNLTLTRYKALYREGAEAQHMYILLQGSLRHTALTTTVAEASELQAVDTLPTAPCPLLTTHCPLLTTHYSLLPAPCSLLPTPYSLTGENVSSLRAEIFVGGVTHTCWAVHGHPAQKIVTSFLAHHL